VSHDIFFLSSHHCHSDCPMLRDVLVYRNDNFIPSNAVESSFRFKVHKDGDSVQLDDGFFIGPSCAQMSFEVLQTKLSGFKQISVGATQEGG
jgi:hypothetical protein